MMRIASTEDLTAALPLSAFPKICQFSIDNKSTTTSSINSTLLNAYIDTDRLRYLRTHHRLRFQEPFQRQCHPRWGPKWLHDQPEVFEGKVCLEEQIDYWKWLVDDVDSHSKVVDILDSDEHNQSLAGVACRLSSFYLVALDLECSSRSVLFKLAIVVDLNWMLSWDVW